MPSAPLRVRGRTARWPRGSPGAGRRRRKNGRSAAASYQTDGKVPAAVTGAGSRGGCDCAEDRRGKWENSASPLPPSTGSAYGAADDPGGRGSPGRSRPFVFEAVHIFWWKRAGEYGMLTGNRRPGNPGFCERSRSDGDGFQRTGLPPLIVSFQRPGHAGGSFRRSGRAPARRAITTNGRPRTSWLHSGDALAEVMAHMHQKRSGEYRLLFFNQDAAGQLRCYLLSNPPEIGIGYGACEHAAAWKPAFRILYDHAG